MPLKIGALTVATTALLHASRPARAAEGGPAAGGDRAREGDDHGRARSRPGTRSWRARGSASPATPSASQGPFASPTSTGSATARRRAVARRSRTSTTSRSRSTSPTVYIVPGFNPGMPVINKPPIGLTDQEILAVIAYLQSLGGKVTVTLESKVWPLGAARAAGADAARCGRRSRELCGSLRCPSTSSAGRWCWPWWRPFVLLRFRAGPHLRLGAGLLGRDLRRPPLRLRDADPLLGRPALHGHRRPWPSPPTSRSSQRSTRRVRRPDRGPGRRSRAVPPRCCGAASCCCRRSPRRTRGSARQRTLEAPAFGRTVHPAPPDTITVRDKTIDLAHGRNPLRELERTEPAKFRAHVGNGRPDLLPELRLLPRRRHGRGRHVRPRPQPDPHQLHRQGHDRPAPGVVPLLAHREGRPGPARPRAGRGTRPCPPGRSS